MEIEIKNLSKEFNGMTVIDNISLSIKKNEFVSIIGPSGCGKTTFLNILAGFETYQGEVLVEGEKVMNPGPDRFVVHQDFEQLLPWKTVNQNVDFGLMLKNVSEEESQKRIKEVIELVGLNEFENHYPHELSGGMQQRVAIARALVMNPKVLLMDEPFGSLDSIMRKNLQSKLIEVQHKMPKTIVFITHNVYEAAYLSDRIIIFTELPVRVKKEIKINIPRPRNPDKEEFVKIWKDLRKFLYENKNH